MFLIVNKPRGITSHDVVDRIREITNERTIGHGGTLDPNATGLLIIGIGRESTKKLSEFAKNTKKTYIAEIILGEERDTDDVTGILRLPSVAQDDKEGESNIPSLSKIRIVLKEFVVKQMQVPPEYSAIKLKGKKAYELARMGKKVDLKPREITIYSIILLNYIYPILKVEMEVSSGTYIRSFARDLGRSLSTGAYLNNLERISVGEVSLDLSVKLEVLNRSNWKTFTVELSE